MKKLAIVFHGWTGSPSKFRLPLDGWMDEVIYPTLSGHALPIEDEYEKALAMAVFSDEDWVNDVYYALKQGLERENTAIYVFSHSIGLYLVAQAIEQLEDEGFKVKGKIVKIISYAAPERTKGKFRIMLGLSRFSLLHQLSRLNKEKLRWLSRFPILKKLSSLDPEKFLRQYNGVNLVHKGGTEGSNKWVAWSNIVDLATAIREGKRALKKLMVPVVAIQGTKDESVHPSSVQRICSRVAGESLPLLLEGARHTPDENVMAELVALGLLNPLGMKPQKSMTLEEFVRQMRNANWGHFTPDENDVMKKHRYAISVLDDRWNHTRLALPFLRRTKSLDGQYHLWYDASGFAEGMYFGKKTNKGDLLVYVSEESGITLYV